MTVMRQSRRSICIVLRTGPSSHQFHDSELGCSPLHALPHPMRLPHLQWFFQHVPALLGLMCGFHLVRGVPMESLIPSTSIPFHPLRSFPPPILHPPSPPPSPLLTAYSSLPGPKSRHKATWLVGDDATWLHYVATLHPRMLHVPGSKRMVQDQWSRGWNSHRSRQLSPSWKRKGDGDEMMTHSRRRSS